MKKAVVFLAVAALAFSAWTAPVSARQAAAAASAWAGAPATRTTSVALKSGASVYAVEIRGRGTFFVSPDTASAPVIAFTSATNDFSSIDRASPLWALLCRDAEARAFARTNTAAQAGATKTSEAAWSSLLATAAGETVSPSATHIESEPSDLRVAPLVQSQWAQGQVDGQDCYNHSTPVLSDGSRAVCGCVATAMAQIMRFHRFPTAAVAPVTRTCYVEASTLGTASATNLTTQGGVYDWANMPLVPADGVTDAQRAAIGKLTSDAGIAAFMGYDTSGSSAFLACAAKGLVEAFGYASAIDYSATEITANMGAVQRAMFSNLDAGYPVLMGVAGDGGHAIVGDGYGYEGGLVYVHLNMGWEGTDDFWYNLPDIDAVYHFTIFDEMVFDIFPTNVVAGTASATLSGRVTDAETNAVAGAAVRVYATGSAMPVAAMTTNDGGVYGVLLTNGTYDVEFEVAGCPVERQEGVAVPAATASMVSVSGYINKSIDMIETYSDVPRVKTASCTGNAWGVDAQMVAPCAQIVVGAETKLYATLDQAIAGGAALVAAGKLADVTIELLKDIPLKATATIDYACKITTAAGVATTPTVTRATGAALSVAAGGALELKNVNFAKGATTVVTVAAGGELRLGADVDFAVPAAVAAVQTADAAGFVLLEGITSGFTLDCAAAQLVKGVFGSSWCSAADVAESAARIANYYDRYGEQRGAAEDTSGDTVLSWANVPVPLADAAAYFTDKDGNTIAAARLDRALANYEAYRAQGLLGDAPEVVVRNRTDLSLSQPTAVSGSMTLRGETDGVTIDDIASGAGFVIGQGASLTVKNLTFDGAARLDGSEQKLDTLFLVNGGTLAVKNATFENLTSTNCYSPAIAILSGDATVSSSTFANCRADGKINQRYGGGGLFVGEGASLALADTTITGCYAATFGGGVFAYYGAAVTISGNMVVRDNASGLADPLGQSDNLHLLAGFSKEASLALAGTVTGDVGVFWRKTAGTTPRQSAGGVLATAASAGVASASASAFLNDRNATLVAAADGANLVWEARVKSDREVEDPEDAIAVVTPADGGATRYYASLADAAATLTGDATITMKANDTLTNEVTIAYAVTLGSAGAAVTIDRDGALGFGRPSPGFITVAKGASLVIRNVTLDGAMAPGTMVTTSGGSLTLADGATVENVSACNSQNACAIYVADGGMFTMESGACIQNCQNTYADDAKFEYAIGGGVRVSRSTAYLKGGKVTNCESWSGGGVAITDKSTVYVSGSLDVGGNRRLDGDASVADNLLVSDNSTLYLTDVLTGDVGVMAGVSANTNIFGFVAATFAGSAAQLANSAHRFTNDQTGDVGIAVKSESGTDLALLVWSDALDVNGEVVVNGTNYVAATGGETLTASETGRTTSFVYNGLAQTPTVAGHGFAVTCEAQTDVGTYTATLTPKAGFKWSDGTTAAKTITWEITKATYDLSGVTFTNATFVCDGEAKSIYISGALPKGVEVSYVGNGKTDVGVYTVTASFTGDAVNYEAIPSMTATLTITDGTTPPDPDPDPQPSVVSPTPIAFQSITKVTAADGTTSWQLVVTNRVKHCSYRLLSTDDLVKGFTTTGAWEAASIDGAWTNNVTTTTEKFFWRAEGKDGVISE